MKLYSFNRLLIITAATLVLTACLDQDDAPASTESLAEVAQQSAMEHGLKHQDDKYVCPMHPQIVRDDEGSCPICGMNLVKVDGGDDQQAGAERKLLYYRHPHNPTITSDVPMKDEMGMDFVPIYETGGASVKISPTVVNNMGVRTMEVKRDRLWRRIDTVANVGLDENRLSHVHLRTDGWIEQLVVKSEGERVARGDVLFQLYSPTLVNAQEEYLQALAAKHTRLIDASEDRLRALGVSNGQINQLKKTRKVQQRLRIYAPQSGIVAKLNVREGMYVKPATEVMTLADLSSVWLIAEVFERQAAWVRVGAPAEVQLAYHPGRTWEGAVDFIYPSLDAKTRTLKVRLRFDNADEALKPNMFAKVTIFGGARKDILVVPRESLIRTGQQDRVILAQGEGRFMPRTVTVGMESGDWVEIMDGLRVGDIVVTSGQFLIDSEASLKASILRLSDASSSVETGTATPMAAAASADMAMAMPAIVGTGTLKALMPEEAKLNMAHDPIPAIAWPAMVMDFGVKSDVSLDGLTAGDKVSFDLEKTDQGYVISALRKQPTQP